MTARLTSISWKVHGRGFGVPPSYGDIRPDFRGRQGQASTQQSLNRAPNMAFDSKLSSLCGVVGMFRTKQLPLVSLPRDSSAQFSPSSYGDVSSSAK